MQAQELVTSRLTRAGDLVKAKLIALGLRLGDVAAESGLKQATLSDLISGRRKNRSQQHAITKAVRRLAGVTLPIGYLWGELQEAGE